MVPGILGTKRFEPHFWDNKVHGNVSNLSREKRCELLSRYLDCWDTSTLTNATLTFEKTPSLLSLPGIPETIRNLQPHTPKIIIILRDPVQRAYSQYKMAWEMNKHRLDFPSFDDTVTKEIRRIKNKKMKNQNIKKLPHFSNSTTTWNPADFGLLAPKQCTFTLMRGCYAPQIRFWMKYFELGKTLKVVHYEAFEQNRSGILQDILTFVGGGITSHDDHCENSFDGAGHWAPRTGTKAK